MSQDGSSNVAISDESGAVVAATHYGEHLETDYWAEGVREVYDYPGQDISPAIHCERPTFRRFRVRWLCDVDFHDCSVARCTTEESQL